MRDLTTPIKQQAKHSSDNVRNNPDFADKIYNLRKIEHFSFEGNKRSEDFSKLTSKTLRRASSCCSVKGKT